MTGKNLQPWPSSNPMTRKRAGRKKTFEEPAMRVRIPVRLKNKFDQWLKQELSNGMQELRGKARGNKTVGSATIAKAPRAARAAGTATGTTPKRGAK